MNVKRWAIDLMTKPFLVLDVETTGLSSRDEVVQIAITDRAGTPLLNSLVRPASAPIGREALAVHGITPAMVKDTPGMEFFADTLKGLVHNRIIVAFNADFDHRMLQQSLKAVGIYPDTVLNGSRWEDVMVPYARYWGAWDHRRHAYRWQSLDTACKQQKIAVNGEAHSALGDCLRTLALLRVMAGVKENG